jgi:3-hydroxybutyryl-CoA dehydrogenase
MEIKKIFVAGAGLMGGGIAQVCVQAGYQVTMRDVADEILQKSLKTINWSVGKFVEKGKVAGTVDEIMGRLNVTTDLAAASDADFVFEAIIENPEAKRELFAELDKLCPAHTILATNTSAIPVTEIAVATQRVAKVAGTHFFSPVHRQRNNPREYRCGRNRPQSPQFSQYDRGHQTGRVRCSHGRRHRQRHAAGLRQTHGSF